MYRVTQPYLNLLVKPQFFFKFSGKDIILCLLKGEMRFKMHKIIFFFPKKKISKKKYEPTLPKIVRPITLNTLIFLFGQTVSLTPLSGQSTKYTQSEKNTHSLTYTFSPGSSLCKKNEKVFIIYYC